MHNYSAVSAGDPRQAVLRVRTFLNRHVLLTFKGSAVDFIPHELLTDFIFGPPGRLQQALLMWSWQW
jgi:hypothetical protein